MLLRPRIRCAAQRAPWLLLIFLLPVLLRAQSPELAGTMPEDYLPGLKPILQTALSQSPQVLLLQIRIAQREPGVYEANHERLPNVGANIRYAANQTAISSNSDTKSRDSGLFYNVAATQALFHWGTIKNRVDFQRLEVAIAEKEYVEAYRLAAVELRGIYLRLIARNAELRHARYAAELRAAELASAKERGSAGAVSAGEIAGRELQLNEFLLEIDRKQLEFDVERRRFSRLAGMPDIPAEQIPFEIPLPRFDGNVAARLLADLLRTEGAASSAVVVADMHLRQAELDRKIANVRLRPMFDASLNHSRESSTTATPVDVSQTAITRDTLQIEGRWSIFDGFATKGAKLQALANKRYWERQRKAATEAAMDEAQRLERTIGLDVRSIQFAEERLAGARGLVDRAVTEQKAGATAANVIDEAKRELRFAEANAMASRANFLTDWATFVSLAAEDPVLSYLPSRYAPANAR